jgi:hypothetical protein
VVVFQDPCIAAQDQQGSSALHGRVVALASLQGQSTGAGWLAVFESTLTLIDCPSLLSCYCCFCCCLKAQHPTCTALQNRCFMGAGCQQYLIIRTDEHRAAGNTSTRTRVPIPSFSYIQYLVAAKVRLLALIIDQTCMAHAACMLKLVRDTCIDIRYSCHFFPIPTHLTPVYDTAQNSSPA